MAKLTKGMFGATQNTKVTIVHGDKQLLNPAYPDKFRRNIERRVRARGIDEREVGQLVGSISH